MSVNCVPQYLEATCRHPRRLVALKPWKEPVPNDLCTSHAEHCSQCSGSINFAEESLLSVPYGKPGHREVNAARLAQT